MKPTVGFAGMTHLGLVSAAAVAGQGFKVVCFDGDQALVDRLAQRQWPVLEPGLDELIRSNGARQQFTAAPSDLAACGVIYVAPDVPTDDQGRGDVTGLTALIHDIAAVMDPGAVMVVLSQVPPGYTRTLGVLPQYLHLGSTRSTQSFGRPHCSHALPSEPDPQCGHFPLTCASNRYFSHVSQYKVV